MSTTISENNRCWEKGYIWNPSKCTCENGKYLGSIIDDLAITYDETKEVTKTFQTKTIFKNKWI